MRYIKHFSRVSIATILVLVATAAAAIAFAYGSFGASRDVAPISAASAAAPSDATPPTPIPMASPPPGTMPPVVRNLALYENGGTIQMCISDATQQAAVGQARVFLLRKWIERRPGQLAMITTSPGGQAITGRFYVEQNDAGNWRVMLEIDGRVPEEFYYAEEIGVDVTGRPIINPGPGAPQSVGRRLHLKQNAQVNMGLVL